MGRRSYGTGHLYEKAGSWYGRWRDPLGRQVNRKVAAKRAIGERDGLTKAQAEKKLRQMIEDASLVASSADRVTIEEAAASLKRQLVVRGAKKSYLETVESILRVHTCRAPQLVGKDLAAITERDIELYIAAKHANGLAPKTIRNHLGVLHSIFELGMRRGWCVRNPV
jgi:hypothetical protein